MPLALTILQLDTNFPRVAGDVACPATYRREVEIIRVPRATVGQIVSDRPAQIDIAPFEDALARSKGAVVATSCGFLSYWQEHLAGLTSKPVVTSALIALDNLAQTYAPGEILIVTFDAASLTEAHLGQHAAYSPGIVGLPADMHLRQVISRDLPDLDAAFAGLELVDFVRSLQRPEHKHLLLECTNLPPYKAALHAATKLPITDILTLIEATRPGIVQRQFLTAGTLA